MSHPIQPGTPTTPGRGALSLTAVRSHSEGDAQVLDVFTRHPGLPAHIEVRDALLGLQKRILARTAAGRELPPERVWKDEYHEVRCTDPQTGLTTRIDPNTLDLLVESPPEIRFEDYPGGHRQHSLQSVVQHVLPDGTMVVRTNVHRQHVYHNTAAKVGSLPISDRQADYVETVIPRHGRPESVQVHEAEDRRVLGSSVRTWLEQDRLSLAIPGQGITSFQLFITPAQLSPTLS